VFFTHKFKLKLYRFSTRRNATMNPGHLRRSLKDVVPIWHVYIVVFDLFQL
jgi:hypothetical protein